MQHPTNVNPASGPRQPSRIKHSFAHSTWISRGWEWFLELMGRAAEAILVVSVLYSSAKLLPVVHMPAALDVVVFVAQFIALDVGGLSLGKLAKQAKAAHDDEGAKQASRMSTALIVIMIAGVVVVALEQLFPIPGSWKVGIDTVLLIARSILAVLYGHIIHSIKVDEHPAQPHDDPHVQPAFQHALAEMQATFEHRLQQSEAASEAKIASMVRQSEARFEAFVRQRVTVSEAKSEAPNPRHEAPAEARPLPQNVRLLKQPEAALTEKRAAVYRLAEQDTSLSSYAIAEQTRIPVSTVQRYLRERREASSEATGTDE